MVVEKGFQKQINVEPLDKSMKWKNQRSYTVGPPVTAPQGFESRNDSLGLKDTDSWSRGLKEFDEKSDIISDQKIANVRAKPKNIDEISG